MSADTWYAYWTPFTSKNEERNIETKYDLDPSLLYGFSVSARKEGQGHYALQYLTGALEGQIKSRAAADKSDELALDEFYRWRGHILERLSGDRYLFTDMTYGAFSGNASFRDLNTPSFAKSLPVNSRFFAGNLLWMRMMENHALGGYGLRLTSYKIPAVWYKTQGDVILDANFSDTEFRTVSFAVAILDGSRVSPQGKSPRIPFIGGLLLDDFILYLGYGESRSPTFGRGKGLAVGMEGFSGVKGQWNVGNSVLTASAGLRFLYSLIGTWHGDQEAEADDLFLGPFVSVKWVF